MKKPVILFLTLPLLAAVVLATMARQSTPTAITHQHAGVVESARSESVGTSMRQIIDSAGVFSHDALKMALQRTSLADTEPPPVPALDPQGNLAKERSLRDVFDYFSSLSGERDPTGIQRLIEAYLSLHLPSHAVTQALQIFEQYKKMNAHLILLADSLESDNLQEKLHKIAGARREILGDAVADAFFGEEEAYDLYSLSLIERHASPTETSNPLDFYADALAGLPFPQQERQRERLRQHFLVEGTQRLEKEGATAAEIYQFQVLHGDPGVAERYQALSTKRDAWHQRLEAYRQQRIEILRLTLDNADKTLRIQQLLETSFNETEILRINALENMETR